MFRAWKCFANCRLTLTPLGIKWLGKICKIFEQPGQWWLKKSLKVCDFMLPDGCSNGWNVIVYSHVFNSISKWLGN